MLDEIDAALDNTNIGKVGSGLKHQGSGIDAALDNTNIGKEGSGLKHQG